VTLAARRNLLAVVLDTLVPASAGFPGAGAIALDHVLAVAAGAPEIDALLSGGLAAIEDAARAAGDAGLAPLDQDRRERVLRGVEQTPSRDRRPTGSRAWPVTSSRSPPRR